MTTALAMNEDATGSPVPSDGRMTVEMWVIAATTRVGAAVMIPELATMNVGDRETIVVRCDVVDWMEKTMNDALDDAENKALLIACLP